MVYVKKVGKGVSTLFSIVGSILLVMWLMLVGTSSGPKEKTSTGTSFLTQIAHADFPKEPGGDGCSAGSDSGADGTECSTGGSGGGSGGSGGGSGGSSCFIAGTLITMMDSSVKPIEAIVVGDYTKGGEVTGVMQYKEEAQYIFDYRGTIVAGSHAVFENGVWKRVADSDLARSVDLENDTVVVYNFNCTKHRIYIGKQIFGDNVELDSDHPVEEKYFDDAIVALNEFEKHNMYERNTVQFVVQKRNGVAGSVIQFSTSTKLI